MRRYVAAWPSPRCVSLTEAATAYVYLVLNNFTIGPLLPMDVGGWLA